jgi:hypothetical protein
MNIPKKIHQIWIGPKILPEKYVEMTATMEAMHPEWEYKMWTHDEIFNDRYADDIYLQAYLQDPDTFKWAFITDRIKLLLLRDFGGVYVDVDAKYIKPFDLVMDKLEEKHTFFAGMKTYDVQSSLIECAVYGAAPNSRLINLCLDFYSDTRWAHGCMDFSNVIIHNLEDDALLLNSKYFYSFEEFEQTIVLHEPEEIRLHSHSDENSAKEEY